MYDWVESLIPIEKNIAGLQGNRENGPVNRISPVRTWVSQIQFYFWSDLFNAVILPGICLVNHFQTEQLWYSPEKVFWYCGYISQNQYNDTEFSIIFCYLLSDTIQFSWFLTLQKKYLK